MKSTKKYIVGNFLKNLSLQRFQPRFFFTVYPSLQMDTKINVYLLIFSTLYMTASWINMLVLPYFLIIQLFTDCLKMYRAGLQCVMCMHNFNIKSYSMIVFFQLGGKKKV